jgi:hypothetical protein
MESTHIFQSPYSRSGLLSSISPEYEGAAHKMTLWPVYRLDVIAQEEVVDPVRFKLAAPTMITLRWTILQDV